jgi:5-methylcytosine-specific restriction endonuclease McrA
MADGNKYRCLADALDARDFAWIEAYQERQWEAARLANPVPEATRRAVLERARGCCEDCGDQLPLELHHLRYYAETEYKGVPDSIFGRETPCDLDALCRECHRQRHIDPNGDWWNDPEEMADHWWYYNEEMSKD